MNKSRKWISMVLAIIVLSGISFIYAPEAAADVRVIRTPSHHGSCWGYPPRGGGYCVPQYRPPVHCHSYALQERRVFIGYDHCGRAIYKICYVRVRTCGCP